ncbi:RNA-directed DNA polymerase-like protein [Gossypium australe]|uniref:RNA-directed DNA polymerase-like protein n=1 Tax=Gossypium australe TaxID=47621 RepID=A0A5B6WFI3_9ROSI|nr:RNA-directed DNA polymerase-like protein [Gossypium australe]
MRPDVLLKMKEEVKKKFDTGFLQVVKYSEWVANIIPVPKKDGKVRMCVDYRDLNKASLKDNFSLPHTNTLVDNTTGYSLFSFMDGFSGYNQIKVHPEDMDKTTFLTMWGTFCYKKCDPIFRLLKKQNPVVWDEECHKTFDKVKHYLSNFPVLMPPNPDRLRQYILYHTTWLISKLDLLKYMMESTALNGRMVRWQILLSEFDIVYVKQKAVKGSAIADFLASRALEDHEPLNFDFPNEDLIIRVVLVSPNGDHYPFTSKLDFDCMNNMVEYKACIMGIRVAIEREIKVLKMADALATLASMVKANKQDVKPIQMSIYKTPAHCYNIEEEEEDDHPWYHDILRYVKNRVYPD